MGTRRSSYVRHASIDDCQYFHLQLWTNVYPILTFSGSKYRRTLLLPALDIRLKFKRYVDTVPSSLEHLLAFRYSVSCVIDLSKLKDLLYPDACTLAYLARTEELSVGPPMDQGLCSFLESETSTRISDDGVLEEDSAHKQLFMPKLKLLVLRGIDMRPPPASPAPSSPSDSASESSEHSDPEVSIPPIPVPPFPQALESALRKRQTVKLQLEKLVFRDCENLLQQDIDSLRAVVASVDWDGMPGYGAEDVQIPTG